MQHEHQRKTSLYWVGPYHVVKCKSDYIFMVENLLDGKRTEVHGRRLKLLRNKDYEVSEEILEHLQYQTGEPLVVESFTEITRPQGIVEIQVKWRDFTEDETDWVQLSSLLEDVPQLVPEYLEKILSSGSKRQRSVAASLYTKLGSYITYEDHGALLSHSAVSTVNT